MKHLGIIPGIFFALLVSPAHAQDNNPFSGATSITVVMVRDLDRPINISKYKAKIRHLARSAKRR